MKKNGNFNGFNAPSTLSDVSRRQFLKTSGVLAASATFSPAFVWADRKAGKTYTDYVRECMDTLLEYGTDRYGEKHTPVLVSILDIESRTCPANPDALCERFRVIRRGRRNPAGSNLSTDQPMLRSMHVMSGITNQRRYAAFADRYAKYAMEHLVDDKGLFWWGWHRSYNVHEDRMERHDGGWHELHGMDPINWDNLWSIDQAAVTKQIEATWQWHVINKNTGEINRHDDGVRGCDFTMSAASFIEAFAFMYVKTNESVWLDRAKLLADYYWERRNRDTDMIPERPNAGRGRFDGTAFVTAVTGLYCNGLLSAYEQTKEERFRDYALAHLRAYANYGYDDETGKYWGALRLNGQPIPGPRARGGYAGYEPRGHLELWDPYAAGYQHAHFTAQAYATASRLTNDADMRLAANRFATWMEKVPPGTVESDNTWYGAYSTGIGREGTYACKYGRTITFLLDMYKQTGERSYLNHAKRIADEAVEKLFHRGLFRGHPSKPYYEAVDGVGFLAQGLLQLDSVLKKAGGTEK